jgi:hypothetical protein
MPCGGRRVTILGIGGVGWRDGGSNGAGIVVAGNGAGIMVAGNGAGIVVAARMVLESWWQGTVLESWWQGTVLESWWQLESCWNREWCGAVRETI